MTTARFLKMYQFLLQIIPEYFAINEIFKSYLELEGICYSEKERCTL